MMWGADLENSSQLARDRHAAILAEAINEQQRHSLLPPRRPRRSVWQWLRQAFQGRMAQKATVEPSTQHHSVLQS